MVAKRYRVLRLIGEGGMGSVWAAEQTLTGRMVALKVLKGTEEMDPALRERFLREGRAACAVEHPNVVRIYDVMELDDGTPMIVMELLEGETLAELIARTGALPPSQVADLMLPVISAVGTAHSAGIVHRDLKPENILIASQPDGSTTVKVLDFGIAKMSPIDGDVASAALTSTGAIMGTPYYMSPEQAFAEKDIDHRADIWSLGIILYECASGRLPTEAESLGQILKTVISGTIRPLAEQAPRVPRDICNLVDRMLEVDRDERPADLREILGVLRRHGSAAVASFCEPVARQRFSIPDLGAVTAPAVGSAPVAAPGEASLFSESSIQWEATRQAPASDPSADTQLAGTPPSTRVDTPTVSLPTSAPGRPIGGATAPGQALTISSVPGQRRRVWAWAAGLLVVAGGGIGAIAMSRGGGVGSRPAAFSGVAPPQAVTPAAPSAAPPRQEPTATAPITVTTSSASSSAASDSAPASSPPRSNPRRRWQPTAKSKPAPPSTASAQPTANPTATKPPTSPGGVVEKPPF